MSSSDDDVVFLGATPGRSTGPEIKRQRTNAVLPVNTGVSLQGSHNHTGKQCNNCIQHLVEFFLLLPSQKSVILDWMLCSGVLLQACLRYTSDNASQDSTSPPPLSEGPWNPKIGYLTWLGHHNPTLTCTVTLWYRVFPLPDVRHACTGACHEAGVAE